MSITVMGATGQLGRLVIDELLRRVPAGEVAAVVRDPQRAADIASNGVELRVADYDKPDSLRGVVHPGDKVLLISSNDLGRRIPQHTAVIDAASEAGAALLAYTSILGGPNATFVIAEEIAATEPIVIDSGLPFTVLRNGWYNENYSGNLATTLKFGSVLGCADDGRVASASRRDYAAAAAIVLADEGHQNEVYELSGDTAWTLAEYAEEVAAQTGRDITYTDLPGERYREIMVDAGVPAHYADALVDADVAISRGELAATTGDLSRLIGRATTPIADSIKAALNS
jgi:NAD(P)H dehydrogenase (quinone)